MSLSVKDAVVELLSSEENTDAIFAKVDPANHEEVVTLLKSVKDKLSTLVKSVEDKLAKNATLGYPPAGGDGGTPTEKADPVPEGPATYTGGGQTVSGPGARSIGAAFGKDEGSDKRKGAIKDKGFFATEHLHEVLAKPTHTEARNYAHSLVDGSNAHEGNKAKARDMINRSKNTRHLALGMSNFMMAHPSEGMGMNPGKKS